MYIFYKYKSSVIQVRHPFIILIGRSPQLKMQLELASLKKITISIVGGGSSVAEIAGSAWRLTQDYGKNKPLDKVGVYAVRENLVLYQNLMASLEGRALQAFDPGGDYLLIFNMVYGTEVLHKKWLTFDGRLAFKIKDYIDRKFMNKFQKIEMGDYYGKT